MHDSQFDPQPEAEAKEHPDGKMIWNATDGTLTNTFAVLNELVQLAQARYQDRLDLIEEGAPEEYGNIEVTLTSMDNDVIALGLHLAGLFHPNFREHAEALANRLYDLTKAVLDAKTDEEKQVVADADNRLQEKRYVSGVSNLLGISEEEVREQIAQAKERAGEDEEPVDPVEQASWSGGAA